MCHYFLLPSLLSPAVALNECSCCMQKRSSVFENYSMRQDSLSVAGISLYRFYRGKCHRDPL